MKDKSFYNKARKFVLKYKKFCYTALKFIITVSVVLLLGLIILKLSQVIWYSFNAIWDDPSLTQSKQPLQLAIGLLTLLVTIIAISMGALTWLTRREWDKFRKEQEPIINDLKKESEEQNWLDQLRKSMKEDPHLKAPNALGTIRDIKGHYFERDQYNDAWKYYGVARWFDEEDRYDRAIEYYEKADGVDLKEGNGKSKELRKHIKQSLGKNYFQHGMQLEAKGKNADAIKDYEAAIKYYKAAIEDYEAAIVRYDWVIEYDPQFAMAHFNKASTLIQLGKIEGDKSERYNDAIECLKKAIEIEDNYDHFYDKARAHARLNQPDEAIESLTRAFNLAKRDNLGDLFCNLARDHEDFKKVEGKAEFKALLKRYRDSYKGNN